MENRSRGLANARLQSGLIAERSSTGSGGLVVEASLCYHCDPPVTPDWEMNMVAVNSTMVPLGTPCPEFQLVDGHGKLHRRADFANAPALVVAFISNHCPYVKHLREGLADFGRDMAHLNVAMVAIGSNNVERYPADSPDKMIEESQNWGYTFPYLYDESQDVAKAFKAACTPDFYVYDGVGRLVYRGQFDDSRPGNGLPVSGGDLRNAVHATVAGRVLPPEQVPSIGCNIKWIPGNEPPYFA